MDLDFDTIQQTIAECRKLGTDKEFQEFVRSFGSCLTGKRPVVYAHVRRASLSGVGMKPEFSGVPLTDDEHKIQHQHGEAALLRTRWPETSREAAKDWFDKEAQRFRLLFIERKRNDRRNKT